MESDIVVNWQGERYGMMIRSPRGFTELVQINHNPVTKWMAQEFARLLNARFVDREFT